jgi:hypothetical protein
MRSTPFALLASSALLATVGSAFAADLPSLKAAPVEYVKICSSAGEGFFYIPGTDTCISIGGRVRAEYRYVTPFDRAQDATGFLTRGRLNIDARTETAYGTLRAFFRYELTALRGSYADIPFFGGQTNTSILDKAFIQFAGITAGRVQSFFDFYANELNFGTIAGSDNSTSTLAYTATFGAGFSATLGIEDRAERQVVGISPLDPFGTIFVPGGERMPNVIANLRYDNTAFGAAQLSGAVAQLNSVNRDVFGGFSNSDYGFAIQAAVQLNLPVIAPGDQLWLQAAYADGALNYLGVGNSNILGGITIGQSDSVVDVFGNTKRTQGFTALAAFLHYWTPSFRQAVFGTYTRLNYSSQVAGVVVDPFLGVVNTGFVDSNQFQIGTNLLWSPVKGLDIGPEIVYTKLDPRGRVPDFNRGAGIFTVGSADAIDARLRFQRDF